MVIEKLLLGVTLAAPIGPVSVEMINRGLKSGFWAAFNIRVGGAMGNMLCLIAAFLGLSAIQRHELIMQVIGLLGCALLLYMAYTTLKKGFKPIELKRDGAATTYSLRQSLILGFMLAVFNPVGVVFWLSIFASDVTAETIGIAQFMLNTLIVIGVLMWGAFLSGLLAVGRRFVNPVSLRWVTLISGLVLLYFGAKYAWHNPLLSQLFIA